MSYEKYEETDVKPKKSKQTSDRSYTGPCETCRKKIDGVAVNSDGSVECPHCGRKPIVAKKL